jgi:hypothetical protein
MFDIHGPRYSFEGCGGSADNVWNDYLPATSLKKDKIQIWPGYN